MRHNELRLPHYRSISSGSWRSVFFEDRFGLVAHRCHPDRLTIQFSPTCLSVSSVTSARTSVDRFRCVQAALVWSWKSIDRFGNRRWRRHQASSASRGACRGTYSERSVSIDLGVVKCSVRAVCCSAERRAYSDIENIFKHPSVAWAPTLRRQPRRVNLNLYEGEFVVLLGASGGGKSTLLNILGGLDTASAGSVLWYGQEMCGADESELTRFRRRHIGFVFSFYNLAPASPRWKTSNW